MNKQLLYPILLLIFSSLNAVAHILAPPSPTIDLVADPAAIESNAGEQIIQLTGISDANSDIQGVTITATSDNPALIPDPTVNFASPTSSTGSIAYTPQGTAGGSAVITIRVANAGFPETYTEINFTVSVNATTTSLISSSEEASHIHLYPNPVQSAFTIDLTKENSVEKLILYNILGEKIKEININNSAEYVTVEELDKGNYYVVLLKDNGEKLVKKLIKQ